MGDRTVSGQCPVVSFALNCVESVSYSSILPQSSNKTATTYMNINSLKSKTKAVPLHAMEALGGEEV
jgi:hypothetical protein